MRTSRKPERSSVSNSLTSHGDLMRNRAGSGFSVERLMDVSSHVHLEQDVEISVKAGPQGTRRSIRYRVAANVGPVP